MELDYILQTQGLKKEYAGGFAALSGLTMHVPRGSIYGFVGNYGWAVVLFTLLVRLIVMPFDYKSRVGMRKMQKIAPMQAKLQKKYEKDPDPNEQKGVKI